jgi:hypothetical protein
MDAEPRSTEPGEADVAFLLDAARFFDNADTGGEDRAHWANISNARRCREIADRLDALSNPEAQAAPVAEWTRTDLAKGLAMLDGVTLLDIHSTVGPAADANNWREYLGRADDLMAHLSAALVATPPAQEEKP